MGAQREFQMVDNDRMSGYKMPPDEIVALVDANPTPVISLDPVQTWMILLDQPSLPPIAELARPELRLAGLRIDPGTNGPSRSAHYTGMLLKRIEDGTEKGIVGLPDGARIGNVRWAPDGTAFAFTLTGETSVSLWIADVATGKADEVVNRGLNGIFGTPYSWTPDGTGLVYRSIPEDRGDAPAAPTVPTGPVIQENTGKVAPAWTYQDLLRNSHDEALFQYYSASQIRIVRRDGTDSPIGKTGCICHAEPSPDGRYLLVEIIHQPFSYLVPFYRFPERVEVWDAEGLLVRELVDLPLADDVPTAFDGVPKGPRSFGWRADRAATVYWVEAQDGGDPTNEAEIRDCLYTLAEPFDGEQSILQELALRFAGANWGTGDLALVTERWWKNRHTRTWRIRPDAEGVDPEVIFDRSWEDRYSDPGSPFLRANASGKFVLLTDDEEHSIFLAGNGASPEGDFPFVDRFDLEKGETERLWQCKAPHYERPIKLLDTVQGKLLTYRESISEPPNVFVTDLLKATQNQVTTFPHPSPQLAEVHKELIRYPRSDGVQLTATLYLPPGYNKDQGPLPTLLWAYPREFKSSDAAGQVKDSHYRFVRITTGSPLFWLTQGFAILDGPTMPIIGEGDKEANDTYVDQLVASANAAVEELVRRGVSDGNRIAVGGHSYGGFMTANLLAHTDLFCAGIARSGAYNRTLTPFGFQAEERTLWEAPEVYFEMSAFMHVDKIKDPLLLIHGEADNNAGTYPMQSERLYNALKGQGATSRLVLLPHESHGYRGRESVMHTLWEMTEWLNQYVKERNPGD
jgi:dipeptidyl aminopeptidase/acylaminoacyl peptidase